MFSSTAQGRTTNHLIQNTQRPDYDNLRKKVRTPQGSMKHQSVGTKAMTYTVPKHQAHMNEVMPQVGKNDKDHTKSEQNSV